MTTILRMQPTWGKKKKFLSMKFNFFLLLLIDGTADDSGEREKVFPSASTLIKGRARERVRTEIEYDSGALIKRNINQRDDMAMYNALHLLLSRNASCFSSSGTLSPLTTRHPNIDRSFCACECFVCFSPRAFDSSLSPLRVLFSLRRTPFLSLHQTSAAVITKKTSRRMKMS